jgi:hypothetical protein
MADHEFCDLGMHLKISQATPSGLTSVSGTVLTGSATEPACQEQLWKDAQGKDG